LTTLIERSLAFAAGSRDLRLARHWLGLVEPPIFLAATNSAIIAGKRADTMTEVTFF
jgi:hypothetical protein